MAIKEITGWILSVAFALLLGFVVGLSVGNSTGYKNGQIEYAQGIHRYMVIDGHVLKFLDKINTENK